MGYKQQGGFFVGQDFFNLFDTLILKFGITHAKRFVNYQDIRLNIDID